MGCVGRKVLLCAVVKSCLASVGTGAGKMPGGRKTDKEPGKSASTAPPKRLGLSDKTAQAVFVDTEVSRGSTWRRYFVAEERDNDLFDKRSCVCVQLILMRQPAFALSGEWVCASRWPGG